MRGGGETLDSLLGLVKQHCTKEHVQNLLRNAKKESPTKGVVKIGGSAETVIDQNLRDAIQTGAISPEAVYELIESCEESGRQHIFYFEPKDDDTAQACRDAEGIAKKLFGANWREERGFPRRHFDGSEMDWANFRIVSADEPGGPGWVAKLYSGVVKQNFVGTEKDELGRLHKIFVETPSREVYLVRWHPGGILELRVPLERQITELFNSVNALWVAVQTAISAEQFEAIDLEPACRKIIAQHAENKTVYRLGDAHFEDTGNSSLRVCPKRPNQHLMDDEKRRQAVDILERCRLLVVVWLLNEEVHDTKDELRTTIGKLRPNELVLISRTTERALLHVINQLRLFSA